MDIKQVTETIAMIEEQNFDVRTITMGISLLDCIDPDIDKAAEKVYQKIVTKAKDLVAVGDEIAAELGIPIVNKRVSVTPISIIGAATNATDYVPFAKALDRAAKEVGVNFIGGFSALVQKGYQKGDEILINSIPRALAETDFVCSSVNIGSTKTGINMTAVRDMGRIIKEASQADPMGPGKLVGFANAVEDNLFMASTLGFQDLVLSNGRLKKFLVQALMYWLKPSRRQPSRLLVSGNWLVKWLVNVSVLSLVLSICLSRQRRLLGIRLPVSSKRWGLK